MGDGVLIDRKGRVWTDTSVELGRRLGCAGPGAEIASAAVREGFIHIRQQEKQARVVLRERCFSFTAFAGAMLVLGRMKPSRIVLTVLREGPPVFRILLDLHDFCAEVEPLAAGKPVEVRIPRLSERRNRRVLNLPTFACARPIVDLWESTRGELTDEVTRAIAAVGLSGRTIIARQLPRTSRLVFWHIGSGIMLMRPCESLLAIGRELHEQPDRLYGEWVAQAYAETAWERRLRVDSCRALIRTSSGSKLRARYDRVLLPWRAKDELFVMCLSIQRELSIVAS